jgi:hypothetical protein
MARIIDIIRDRRNVVEKNPAEAERTAELAVAALLAGIGKPEWDAYVEHLPGLNAAQLKRLLGTDNTAGDPDMTKKRVYIVANGMCGVNSPNTQTLTFQMNSIDAGLADCD